MQGTVVMLIALSNLGCHNKCYDTVYSPMTYAYNGCYSGGCYANVQPSFMSSCYVTPSCYSACYSSAYNGCYATAQSAGYGSGCYYGGYSAGYGCGWKHRGCGFGLGGCRWLSKLMSCCRPRCLFPDNYCADFGGPYPYGMPYDPPVFGYALQYPYPSQVMTPAQPVSPMTEEAPAAPSAPTPPAPATAPPPPSATISPPPPPTPEPAAPPAPPAPALKPKA